MKLTINKKNKMSLALISRQGAPTYFLMLEKADTIFCLQLLQLVGQRKLFCGLLVKYLIESVFPLSNVSISCLTEHHRQFRQDNIKLA